MENDQPSNSFRQRFANYIATSKYSLVALSILCLAFIIFAALIGGAVSYAIVRSNSNTNITAGKSCTVGDKTYKDGEGFKSEDGCNTCSCNDGEVACTLMACEKPDESPKISAVEDNGSNLATEYTSTNSITCTWDEDNVQKVLVNIGTTPGAADVASREVAAGVKTVTFDNISLFKVGTYYCGVQGSKDAEKSSLVSSDGIFVDASKIMNLSISAVGNTIKPNCSVVGGVPINSNYSDIEIQFWVERTGANGVEYSHEPDDQGWSSTLKTYSLDLAPEPTYQHCEYPFTYEDEMYIGTTAYAKAISKQTGKVIGQTSKPVTGEIQGSGLRYNN